MKIVKSIEPKKTSVQNSRRNRGPLRGCAINHHTLDPPTQVLLEAEKNCPETPYALSLARRMLWSTESKAFAKPK